MAGTCGWDLWLGLVAGTGPLAYADLYRNSNHHLVAKRLDIAIISSVLNKTAFYEISMVVTVSRERAYKISHQASKLTNSNL